jgi:DNA topoisomerase-1
MLPPLHAGQVLQAAAVEAKGHSTVPPARFSEASLVKKLEELGVGRPSTYASIIATIQDRGYVWKKGTALVPSFIAFAVVGLLERHFSKFVDYGFTADMEEDLDEIADGDEEQVPWLSRFYFGKGQLQANSEAQHGGNGYPGLKWMVEHLDEIDPVAVNSIPLGHDAEGRDIIVRVGRFGPYLQRGDERASIPVDMAPDEVTIEWAENLLAAPSEDRALGADPDSGRPVYVRAGRFGPYVQLGETQDDDGKPARASLFSYMDPSAVTLEEALKLLGLPRVVGTDPSDGEEVSALNGRYGPYLKKGTDTRTLASEDQIFTITLDEALALFAQPKTGGRRGASAALKEMGPDPETGSPILLKEGRFGPYVTDGTTNASLPRDETVDSISLERSIELLADKRANPPKKKTTRKRKTTKSKTTKSRTAKRKTAT